MKQINVETATREQLVDFIRRMHSQRQRDQERVKELESQINGFQDFIHEKNAEIRELRQQSDRLTEKSASDEETIGALIKQMEEMRLEQAPASTAPRSRTADQGATKAQSSGDGFRGDRTPEAMQPVDASGNSEGGRRPSRTPPQLKDNSETNTTLFKAQNGTAAATISTRTDEVAKLEHKVRELMEVNAFYSAIVAQHDQEEKARMGQRLVCGSEQSEDTVARLRQEVDRLQFHISDLDVQEEKLQRIIKATEAEKTALRQDNELLKRETVQLEAEMGEMTRKYLQARRSIATSASRHASTVDLRLTYADEEAFHTRAESAPQQSPVRDGASRAAVSSLDQSTQQTERRHASLPIGAASRMSPLSYEGRQSTTKSGGIASTPSANPSPASRSRFNFRSLRPVRMRNPDAHEKDLLDRIHLYEEQFAQMELFEADRQRGFDEMERNRAEMFAAMNEQLEKQRKEIHRLRKLHEDASLESSLTARPSHNHSVGSIANREEEDGQADFRRHGAHSPEDRCLTAVPTSTQSLLNVASFDGTEDADASATERDTVTLRSSPQHRVSASPRSSGVPWWLEEFKWREKQGRYIVWREAMESTVDLAALLHASTEYRYTEELAACHAKLLEEREELTSDLEDLQRRNEALEAQLTQVECALQQRNEVTETDAMARTSRSVEKQNSESTVLSAPTLFESKALRTAYLAMEAYDVVLQHYAALLRERERVNLHDVAPEAEGTDVTVEEEVTRDLAEVQKTFGMLGKKWSEASQHAYAELLAFPIVSTDTGESRGPPPCVVDASFAEKSKHDYFHSRTVSASRSSTTSAHSLLREEPSILAAKQRPRVPSDSTEVSLTLSENDGAEVDGPLYVSNQGVAAFPISQDGSRSSSLDHEARHSNAGESVLQPSTYTTATTNGHVGGSEGKADTQLSADETHGTATSQFADCVEQDNETVATPIAPEEMRATGFDGEVCGDTGGSERGRGVLRGTSDSATLEESGDEVDESLLMSSPQSLSHIATPEPTGVVVEIYDEARHDTPGDVAKLRDSEDSSAMSAPSHLDVTEAEEVEFLAQLQREMDNAEANELIGAIGEEVCVSPSHESSSDTESSNATDAAARANRRQRTDVREDDVGGCEEGHVSHTPSAATRGGAEARANEESADQNASDGNDVCSSSTASSHAEAEVAPALVNDEGAEELVAYCSSKGSESSEGGVAASLFPDFCPNVPTVPFSPHLSSGEVQERVKNGVTEASEGTTAAAALPSPMTVPAMIPPTSLDELFGAHPSDPSFLPSLSDAQQNPFEAPSVEHVSSSFHPLPPAPYKTASPRAMFDSQHTAIPTLSPNSMFATPPRSVPFPTLFTRSPSTINSSQLHKEQREEGLGNLSSSSEEEYEAGFDPFA